jgi:outer membrane scaffolding protein for murein synthesis (MipA/OmpV family)
MNGPRAVMACYVAALGGLLCAGRAMAESVPLWEFGLGVGALAFSDYRGADSGHVYPVPIPYFVYRGRLLKADRDGLHGLLATSRFVELKVNVGATTPVRSSTSNARRGMPGLDSTLELGPALELHLWRSANQRMRVDLRLPVAAAMTLAARPRLAGWQFTPRLNLDVANVGGHAGWKLGLLAGPLYADRSYHDYFYGVAPSAAITGRPAYSARAGFGGAQLLVSLSKRFPRYWVGAFVRHDWLGNAVFADSPLVQSRDYWIGGVGIAWMIRHSARNVEIDAAWSQ